MPVEIITQKISKDYLRKLAAERQGDMVKAVVDLAKRIMAVGAELHADEERLLMEQGSKQNDLWGINLWPDLDEANFIQFDSMINLRPGQGNKSRGVDDPATRENIKKIVYELCA